MGPSLTPLAWRGHRYDVRMPGAAFEWLAARSSADCALSAGQDPGLAGLAALEAHEIVLAQARDVHELSGTRDGDDSVCSCGLIVPAGLALTEATGHLDQRRWEPAATVVVAIGPEQRGWGEEPAEALACCQGCGWTSPTGPVPQARRYASAHQCTAGG
ncbi:hypothetical protein [Nocardioides sp.]|uniref:hypothetical protein n=1 Tax=Nocardioides sp. TaxID=35761 RepID=UPI003511A088